MQGTFASFLTCSQCDEKKDTILFIDPGFPVQKQQLVVMGQKYETFDVYDYRGDKAIRVYSYAPHAHLIEDGHRMVTHDGREVGFVKGHHVFEVAAEGFEPEFYTDLDDMLDEELVEKL